MIVEGVYVTGPCIAIMGIVDPEGTQFSSVQFKLATKQGEPTRHVYSREV